MQPYVEATWGWDETDQHRRFETSFEPETRRIIELDNEPIGVLHIEAASSPVRLLNIQLLPAFQRQGYGTAIMRMVAQEAAARPIWLQVLKVNPAKLLYERLGFQTIGESETHWHMLREPTA